MVFLDKLHPEVLKCAICGQVHADLQELHHHLGVAHKLETQDWQPLRDMQRPEPVCSNCLKCFSDSAAVRQHIAMGQCQVFDPTKPLQLAPVKDLWRDIITTGNFRQLLQTPHARLSLKVTCQLCHMGYCRSNDLSLHLQTVHAKLWHQSQRFHLGIAADGLPGTGWLRLQSQSTSSMQHTFVSSPASAQYDCHSHWPGLTPSLVVYGIRPSQISDHSHLQRYTPFASTQLGAM